jgi:hypothetical protein
VRIPSDLAFRLFGYSQGGWFWVANEQSSWGKEAGFHPFVLIADYDGGPSAVVRPRSTTNTFGIQHAAHPVDHSITCKIRKDGWVLTMLWSLRRDLISADSYSCNEPDEGLLLKLRDGAAR